MNTSLETQKNRPSRSLLSLLACALLTTALASRCSNPEAPYDELLLPAAPDDAPAGNALAPVAYAPGGIYLWLSYCGVNGAMAPLGFPDSFGNPIADTDCDDTGFTTLAGVAKANSYCEARYTLAVEAADQTRITAEHAAAGTTPQHRAVLVSDMAQDGVYDYDTLAVRDAEPPGSLVGAADLRQVKLPDGTVVSDHWFSFFEIGTATDTYSTSAAVNSYAPPTTISPTTSGFTDATDLTQASFWSSYHSSLLGSTVLSRANRWAANRLCNGWTTDGTGMTPTLEGIIGDPSATDLRRIATSPATPPAAAVTELCNWGRQLLCVTY